MGGAWGRARTLSNLGYPAGVTGVHAGWREIAQASVTVPVLAPGEQIAVVFAHVFEPAKQFRKLWFVRHNPDLRFGERIVITHMGHKQLASMPRSGRIGTKNLLRMGALRSA